MVYNHLVDLEKLIIDYVEDSALKKRRFPNTDKILSTDISWYHVRIRHDDAKYTTTGEVSRPSASVLFSSTFENNTDKPQVYTLKTQRTTSTTCTYNILKGYSMGSEIGIKVTAPYIEVGASVQREMTVEKMNEHTFTQEMVWSVDNEVCVASGYRTRAELQIQEKQYEGNFTSAIHYSGRINVVLRSKGTSGTFTLGVTDVFNEENGFLVDDDVSTYICEGSCKCRYGVEQTVKLTQEKINLLNEMKDIDINNGIDS